MAIHDLLMASGKVSTPAAIAFAHNDSPFITVFSWKSTGLNGAYSNPATLPASTGYSVAFSQS